MAGDLQIGMVLHLFCHFTKPQKHKLMVLVCINPKPLLLLINSKINAFIQNNPRLLPCHVVIDAASHDFLNHDSYIDCSEVCTFDLDHLHECLRSETRTHIGHVTPEIIATVMDAVHNSPLISQRQKEWILNSLRTT